jgi:hypothetical protein
VGVLQRFERRLEGMVEGAFARAFKSELQPVEVASAIQREMDERAAIVAQGRTLVPNDFVVEISDDLRTGMFRIRSGVIRGSTVEGGEIRQPMSDMPPPSRGFSGGRPRLLVSTEGQESHMYDLTTPVTLLGRGTDCDLRLVDPGVSRHHAEIRVEGPEVVAGGLGSTNGTFVNGQPIRRVTLRDGARVTLGRTTLVFRRDRE